MLCCLHIYSDPISYKVIFCPYYLSFEFQLLPNISTSGKLNCFYPHLIFFNLYSWSPLSLVELYSCCSLEKSTKHLLFNNESHCFNFSAFRSIVFPFIFNVFVLKYVYIFIKQITKRFFLFLSNPKQVRKM